MKNVSWHKIGTRRCDLQKCIQFAYGAGKDLKTVVGSGARYQVYYFDGRATTFYFSTEDVAAISAAFRKKLSTVSFVRSRYTTIRSVCRQCLASARHLVSSLGSQTTEKQLVRLHDTYERLWREFYAHAWSMWFLGVLDNLVEEGLQTCLHGPADVDDAARVAAQPTLLTPVAASEIGLLRLARDITEGRSERTVNLTARRLAQKFGWMSVYNFDDQPREASWYMAEARHILGQGVDPARKLRELHDARRSNERSYQKILRVITSTRLREQFKLLHVAGYLRDAREETRDRLTMIQRELYQAITDRLGFSLAEVIHLTSQEIQHALLKKSSRQSLREIARCRQKHFALFADDDRLRVFDQPEEIAKIERELAVPEGVKELHGQVAFRSAPVKGTVRVVLSNKEVDKVEDGDVLVSSMTKPDYITAMKRASAFITDEGGITCHAAIVAREMNKPCVIGTKIATKVLKDGDEVEVDADKGIVRVLKRGR